MGGVEFPRYRGGGEGWPGDLKEGAAWRGVGMKKGRDRGLEQRVFMKDQVCTGSPL